MPVHRAKVQNGVARRKPVLEDLAVPQILQSNHITLNPVRFETDLVVETDAREARFDGEGHEDGAVEGRANRNRFIGVSRLELPKACVKRDE